MGSTMTFVPFALMSLTTLKVSSFSGLPTITSQLSCVSTVRGEISEMLLRLRDNSFRCVKFARGGTSTIAFLSRDNSLRYRAI